MQLELSPEERDLLVRVLDSDMREVRVEYRRTEDPDFRREVAGEEGGVLGVLHTEHAQLARGRGAGRR